jgi:hypothetical protein
MITTRLSDDEKYVEICIKDSFSGELVVVAELLAPEGDRLILALRESINTLRQKNRPKNKLGGYSRV